MTAFSAIIRFTRPTLLFAIAWGIFFALPAFATTPSDTFLGQQWYLQSLNAPMAWNMSTGSGQVVVAVLDTGVDLDHPDLRANIWKNPGEVIGDGIDNDRNGFVDDVNGWNFIEGNGLVGPQVVPGATKEALHHGTLIAGIIAAVGNNNEGIAGIGWSTKIMPVRVLDSEGSGDAQDVIKGIDYAIRNGADIINLSFTTEEVPESFRAAVGRAKDAGIVVVAAIGNDPNGGIDTDTHPIYPACADGPAGENWVLGVAATNPADQKSSFSNFGSVCVDLSAPGEGIFSTQFADPARSDFLSYGGGWAGTSLAAPMVSGTAALVRAATPRLRRGDIIDVLLRSADPVDDVSGLYRGKLGQGRVNAAAAVALAQERVKQTLRATIAVSGEEGQPYVWLFNDVGTLISGFRVYDEAFRGGVRIAADDVMGDGQTDVVTAPGPGMAPWIRIFSETGSIKKEFLAFESEYNDGVTIAAGDLDSDGIAEIVVGSGPGSSPRVRVFNGAGVLQSDFLAFASDFRGGVEVAVGNIDGIGGSEIIVGVHGNGGPHVRIFDRRGNLIGQFFAFDEMYRNGVRIGAADVGGAIGEEILVNHGGGESASITQFQSNGKSWNTIITYAEDQDGPLGITSRRGVSAMTELFVVGGRREDAFPLVHGFTPIGALISSFPVPRELGIELHIATL